MNVTHRVMETAVPGVITRHTVSSRRSQSLQGPIAASSSEPQAGRCQSPSTSDTSTLFLRFRTWSAALERRRSCGTRRQLLGRSAYVRRTCRYTFHGSSWPLADDACHRCQRLLLRRKRTSLRPEWQVVHLPLRKWWTYCRVVNATSALPSLRTSPARQTLPLSSARSTAALPRKADIRV